MTIVTFCKAFLQHTLRFLAVILIIAATLLTIIIPPVLIGFGLVLSNLLWLSVGVGVLLFAVYSLYYIFKNVLLSA